MKGNNNTKGWPFILSLLIGFLYVGVGIISLSTGIGLIQPIPGFGDLIGSIMVIIVGVVFLSGVKPLSKGDDDAYAFSIVGTGLAVLLFVLQIIIIGTNALGWGLGLEDWITWNIMDDITPSFWLFIIVMMVIGVLRATKRIGGHKGIFPVGM
ncbi:MAG: hypothetical protein ACTSUB_04335 [Candidatus Thorarchaeota archaeon]